MRDPVIIILAILCFMGVSCGIISLFVSFLGCCRFPFLCLYRRLNSTFTDAEEDGELSVEEISRPPSVAQRRSTRRRISTLIEKSTLSVTESKTLCNEGWTCCICLEGGENTDDVATITRLKCNHATHAECLRMWLEKGRAVCCLCNADVFSESTKEPSVSSRGSIDVGAFGSLIVERTEHTPSSPGTSVVIDTGQDNSQSVILLDA